MNYRYLQHHGGIPQYYEEQQKPGTKELILFDSLYKVVGQAELICEDRNQDSGCLWQRDRLEKTERENSVSCLG